MKKGESELSRRRRDRPLALMETGIRFYGRVGVSRCSADQKEYADSAGVVNRLVEENGARLVTFGRTMRWKCGRGRGRS